MVPRDPIIYLSHLFFYTQVSTCSQAFLFLLPDFPTGSLVLTATAILSDAEVTCAPLCLCHSSHGRMPRSLSSSAYSWSCMSSQQGILGREHNLGLHTMKEGHCRKGNRRGDKESSWDCTFHEYKKAQPSLNQDWNWSLHSKKHRGLLVVTRRFGIICVHIGFDITAFSAMKNILSEESVFE